MEVTHCTRDERDPCGCGHSLSWHDDAGRCCYEYEQCPCLKFHDKEEDFDDPDPEE